MGRTLNDEGMISIEIDNRSQTVMLVYQADASYNIADIIAYVEDMTGNRSRRIVVHELGRLMWDIRRDSETWTASSGTRPEP